MRYRGLYLLAAVWLGTISDVYSALISSPFDNFRIECPQNAGAQRLSVRMVESQGLKRQDTVFSISCNNVNELYPWNGMPTEIAEMERENCRYSNSFDPIMDHTVVVLGSMLRVLCDCLEPKSKLAVANYERATRSIVWNNAMESRLT
ncbi:hypothetical protein M3Y96_00817700 [Aphelenchoides besseyi]|nr:hypothetical protein M3Y96_00817700 [Aphelenchoides besseyi]